MAPIVSARTKASDNNSSSSCKDIQDKTTGNNRVRSTVSREKPSAPKKKADEPATDTHASKKPTSSASSTRSSSSAGSSSSSPRTRATTSRSSTTTTGKQATPETSLLHRKERVKTPPATSGASVSAVDTRAASSKPAKTHPLPSSMLNKHKQASVFTTGKKKHKTYVLYPSSLYGEATCRTD